MVDHTFGYSDDNVCYSVIKNNLQTLSRLKIEQNAVHLLFFIVKEGGGGAHGTPHYKGKGTYCSSHNESCVAPHKLMMQRFEL